MSLAMTQIVNRHFFDLVAAWEFELLDWIIGHHCVKAVHVASRLINTFSKPSRAFCWNISPYGG